MVGITRFIMTPEKIRPVFLFLLCFWNMIEYSDASLYIDDTGTASKARPQIEFGIDYYKDIEKEFDPETEEDIKEVSKQKDFYCVLSYGLTDNWEVTTTVPYTFLDDSSEGKVNGFSDIAVGSKYRVWDEKKRIPSYALSFDVKTDNADKDKGLGTGKKNFSIDNIFTKTAGNKIFDLNLGYIFVEGKADDITFYSFDLDYTITKKLSLCNEIYGETLLKGDFDDNVFCYGVSMSYQVTDVISLGSGVGFGISQASPDYQFSNSVTFSF